MTREQFHEYVHEFYGPNGVYPMGATMEQIKEATDILIEKRREEGPAIEGDSLDREWVRDILIEDFGLVWPEVTEEVGPPWK